MSLLTDTKHCFEYSENPSQLKTLLTQIKVFISKPVYKKYFKNDTECRNVYKVTITKGKVKISFNFGDSIRNTEEGFEPELYDILSSVSCEYNTPETFDDFIFEFGYDYSTETKRLFNKCTKHSLKLKKIFTNEDMDCLPY